MADYRNGKFCSDQFGAIFGTNQGFFKEISEATLDRCDHLRGGFHLEPDLAGRVARRDTLAGFVRFC